MGIPGPQKQERLKVTRISCEPITVSLRQWRERRGLLRLRSQHPAARLGRMCAGSSGNRGSTTFIGCFSAREFEPDCSRGEPARDGARAPFTRVVVFRALVFRVTAPSYSGLLFTENLDQNRFVGRLLLLFIFRLPIAGHLNYTWVCRSQIHAIYHGDLWFRATKAAFRSYFIVHTLKRKKYFSLGSLAVALPPPPPLLY